MYPLWIRGDYCTLNYGAKKEEEEEKEKFTHTGEINGGVGAVVELNRHRNIKHRGLLISNWFFKCIIQFSRGRGVHWFYNESVWPRTNTSTFWASRFTMYTLIYYPEGPLIHLYSAKVYESKIQRAPPLQYDIKRTLLPRQCRYSQIYSVWKKSQQGKW